MTELHYPGAMEIAMANATREKRRQKEPMMPTETHTCSSCCADTENEPQALCDACEQEDREATARRLNDMALLIRQLAHALNRHAPEHTLTFKAKDYLIRHGLQGSLLRDEPEF